MDCCLLTWNERERWAECLEQIPPGRRDVYCTPSYCRAAIGNLPVEQLAAWRFAAGGEVAIYPFMLRPLGALNLLEEAKDAYDIEGVYGYNGVMSSTDDPAFAAAFYREFNTFCRDRKIAVEFTRFNPMVQNDIFSTGHLDQRYIHDTVIVDLLQDDDVRWTQSYDSKNRNMIRKAQKSGITCRTSDDWNGFRRLYMVTMDNCHASARYYFDEEYFARLRTMPAAEGRCMILEAVYENKVIAAHLLMFYDRFAHYHLSARDPEYSSMAAGNLLMDYAVIQAKAAGAESLHLGGGRVANDSLMRFKAGFSPLRGHFSLGCKAHDPELLRRLNSAWEERNPEKAARCAHMFMRYRN